MNRALSCILILVLAFLCGSSGLYAQNVKTQEARRSKLEKEIAVLNTRLRENEGKSSSAMSSLALVRKKISNRKELIAESDKEIALIDSRIADKENEIRKMQDRLDTLTAYYSRLVLNAYKNRDTKLWYMYVLASRNVGQAMRRVGYLRSLSSEMNTQARKITAMKDEIAVNAEALKVSRNKAELLRQERLGEVSNLKKEEAQSQSLVSKLKKDKNKYQKELSAKKKQVDALNREIARIIRGSGAGASGTSKPVDMKLDAEFSKNQGKLPWPVDGPVIESFGQHYHPVYKNVKLPFNNGITIAAAKNAEVKAVFDGEVKQIVVMPGYNKCVLIRHGNYFSFYCKLASATVKAGDMVKTGQTIGIVDTMDGEANLHFQIWKGDRTTDPELWLR